MKYLITGGAGFLGSNLCNKLINERHEVICIDNLYTGSKNNISKLLDFDNFEFHNISVLEKFNFDCDGIFHMACPASPPKYMKDPISTAKISFIGTLNMLEIAKKQSIKMFFSSTSEIYGNPLIHPQNENYFGNVNSFGPRACYDEGKRIAETLCYEFLKKNVDVRIARIFNTYGPNMSSDDGRVVSNFIIAALENKPMVINGDGKQTRSFCYVDDLIDGICKLYFLNSPLDNPLNLGNPSEITINEIAEKISTIFEKNINIILRNLPQDDPIQRKPDITLAKKILGWEPKIDLLTGLTKTIEYFKLIK